MGVFIGLCTLVGVMISSKRAMDRSEMLQVARLEKIEELNAMNYKQISERIENLSVLQNKHNNLMERTFNLEKQQTETNRTIKEMTSELEGLKINSRVITEKVDKLSVEAAQVKLEQSQH